MYILRYHTGAPDGNRTRIAGLEGRSSAIELQAPINSIFSFQRSMAEGVGFEPTEACASTVFKTAAIDHSAILPFPGQLQYIVP